jgi:hypothetical protein
MWITPIHDGSQLPEFEKWSLELKIEIFQARVDGWHLAIAETSLANTPHSGWAVLQMVLNYFEVIACFKFNMKNAGSKTRFKKGVYDVFSGSEAYAIMSGIDLADILYGLRNALYHTGIIYGDEKGKHPAIVLSHQDSVTSMYYDPTRDLVVIDPHNLIPDLRKHFAEYIAQLQDPKQIEVRESFGKVFDKYYEA